MLAVHFGAGNIGRGFISPLLYQANYHTIFVDVNNKIIDALNQQQQYKVVYASDNSRSLTINNVSGINSTDEPEKVIAAIAKADLLTTAVGPTILPNIAELIAKGLRERLKTGMPLNIIACENMIGGSSLLKNNVYSYLTENEQILSDQLIGYPNVAVDRIVPNQVHDDVLDVHVEPYYEWVIEAQAIKGKKPALAGITYVNDLKPYIERKLFTVNTGHAVIAYLGYYMGFSTIKGAIHNHKVKEIFSGALHESGEALIQTYAFARDEHEAYIAKIVKRFMNPYISDEVIRVGRSPIRKLGFNDRLIRPASAFMEVTGKAPINLAKTIAAALHFDNKDDEEAVKLQQLIAENSYQKTLQLVSQLSADSPLVSVILNEIDEIKALKGIMNY